MATKNSIKLKVEFSVVSDWSHFLEEEKRLLNKAIEATVDAYAPYSKFNVGAAVLLENGKIIKGNNQENATYPNGLCAERVALFNAASNFPKNKINAIALTIEYEGKDITEPVFPCGSCRQSILEYEDRFKQNIKIYIIGPNKEVVIINSVKDILPFAFSGDFLNHLQ